MKTRVLIVGAGPAGVIAALQAARLGAQTTLVTSGPYGGMAANEGPVPVRTLAYAARLVREARQCGRYGLEVGAPQLDYPRLLARCREVAEEVRARSSLREQLERQGVRILENVGKAGFRDAKTLETERGLRLETDKIILCSGGTSRRLSIPGFELTATHADAWGLKEVPSSLIVIGAGATGVQLASVFNAFGARVQLFETGPRILRTEDQDVSAAMAAALRSAGVIVHEGFGSIVSFERAPEGVRMRFQSADHQCEATATIVVAAVGWTADVSGMKLAAAGIETTQRGFVAVDEYLRTSAPHVFAAGDVVGRRMLASHAMQDGFVAASNAMLESRTRANWSAEAVGSFTDPEYASVGLTEREAEDSNEFVVATVRADSATRAIIDGRTEGFCKLIVDRRRRTLLGCHVVGERAIEIAQAAAIAMTGQMRVEELARVPFSFPTYTGILGRAAAAVTYQLGMEVGWQLSQVEGH